MASLPGGISKSMAFLFVPNVSLAPVVIVAGVLPKALIAFKGLLSKARPSIFVMLAGKIRLVKSLPLKA